jgi:hypothetical protein
MQRPSARSRIARSTVLLALLGTSGLLQGCGFGDKLLTEVDPEDIPPASAITYVDYIEPRMSYYCTGCHNPDSQVGNSAGFNFSSFSLVRSTIGSIVSAAFERKTMPPGAARRMTSHDEQIFRRWWDAGLRERQGP